VNGLCGNTRSGNTVDAVLAGYYEDEATGTIDSLLFGPYGDDGLLHFVGHSRVYDDAAEIARLLEPLKGGTGFHRPNAGREEPVDRQVSAMAEMGIASGIATLADDPRVS
jgi:hypothetical protein